MTLFRGKVIHESTRAGVPGLVVATYRWDERSTIDAAATALADRGASAWRSLQQYRVGSTLTDSAGAFEIEAPDANGPTVAAVVVLGPERAGSDCPPVLHASCPAAIIPGTANSAMIIVDGERLSAAGIPVPNPTGAASDGEAAASGLVADRHVKATVASRMRIAAVDDVHREREHQRDLRAVVQPVLSRKLSRAGVGAAAPRTLVAPGESVREKNHEALRRGITDVVNNPSRRPVMSGRITLSEADRAGLDEFRTPEGGFDAVPSEVLEPILFDRGVGTEHSDDAVPLMRRIPISAELCLPRTAAQQCAERALGLGVGSEGDGEPDSPSTDPAESAESAVEESVARLLAPLRGGHSGGDSPLTARADAATVRGDVRQFLLTGGAADVPSFHDFHQLQIAFEHVWQEAIDDGLLGVAMDVYREIVELGGEPDLSRPDADIGGALRSELRILGWAGDAVRRGAGWLGGLLGGGSSGDREDGPIVRDHRDGSSTGSDAGRDRGDDPTYGLSRATELLRDLERRMREDYGFTIFGADGNERSVNFANLITYRQRWEPLSYQAGELVKTITLAPKETRKFRRKTTLRRKRSEKEVHNSLASRREESTQTQRIESEILRRASRRTNFSVTTEGGFDIKVASGTATTSLEHETGKSSERAKRDFREAVLKATQELKNERSVEVVTEEASEVETEESGEITNPNDEIPVTFLFYELQRRYRVSEAIHEVLPVVLVAQEVPNPRDIDGEWIVRHDWILRRVILDDSFLPALDYLSSRVVGDEIALDELRRDLEIQRQVVRDLKSQLRAIRHRRQQLREALNDSIFERLAERDEHPDIPISADDIREALEEAVAAQEDTTAELSREASALEAASDKYSAALADHLNRRTQISRLRVHIKQNILYYMQAIWSHEPPDQRYFRLHQTPVPVFAGRLRYRIRAELAERVFDPTSGAVHEFEVDPQIDSEFETKPLSEVADLDNLLGFKGNYMLFPLLRHNALTRFMGAPFADPVRGVRDPDAEADISIEDLARWICCLADQNPTEFDRRREELREYYRNVERSSGKRDGEIVVPTESLFIEALPGAHPVLEDFKLRHRALDVEKVRAEVRGAELENVRLAARLLDGDTDDPQVDKRIWVTGDAIAPIVDVGDD